MQIKKTIGMLLLSGVVTGAAATELTTLEQKFSYAIGAQSGSQLKQMEIDIDPAAFSAGVTDFLSGNASQLPVDELQNAMNEGRKLVMQKKMEKAKAAGEASVKFMEENKGKPGVVALENGLQYIEEKAGEGENPPANANVTVNYRGTLISGEQFDSSYDRGQPATFNLERVIPGFKEALTRMKPGAKWKVFVPFELGYGPRGSGGKIGPNEALIFDLELISFEVPPAQADAEKK